MSAQPADRRTTRLRRALVLALVSSLVSVGGCAGAAGARPISSAETLTSPTADAFDEHIRALMQRWGFRGAQVAVARGDALLVERAYGDASETSPVTPQTRFRIASLSKPITAVLVHLLVREGLLELDERVLPRLRQNRAPDDPRWGSITVRHLLEHSGGFDRHQSRDWMFESNFIAKALEHPGPPELDDIVGFVLRQPLDFTPGERFSYSNLGYALLGRVIEDATGQSYAAAVRQRVLAPIGVVRMQLGRTRPEDRPADEATYFADASEARLPSVFPGGGSVAAPDGGFYLPPMAAHGGWIACARDLARFMVAIDGRDDVADLLPPDALERLLAPPRHSSFVGETTHYGHGLFVEQLGHGRSWLHDGSKPGTTAFMMRTEEGLVMVALFNGRPTEGDVSGDVERTLRVAFDQLERPSPVASLTRTADEPSSSE